MDVRTAQEVIYLNSTNKGKYIAFTKTSIKEGTIGKNKRTVDNINFIINQHVPMTKAYINKAIAELKSKEQTFKVTELIRELQNIDPDENHYVNTFVPSEKVKKLQTATETYFDNEIKPKENVVPESSSVKESLQDSTKELINKELENKGYSKIEIDKIIRELQGIEEKALSFLMDSMSTEEKISVISDKKVTFQEKKTVPDETVMSNISDLFKSSERVELAELEENEDTDNFEDYHDILQNIFTTAGYNEDQIEGVLKGLGNDPKMAKEYIATMSASNTLPSVAIASSNEAVNTSVSSDEINESLQTESSPDVPEAPDSKAFQAPFVKRYHPFELEKFFGNSNDPDWDTTLLNSIMNSNLSKEIIDEKIQMLLEVFGKKIGISKALSSTLEEYNEIDQLCYCVMRNLQRGDRHKTANVKLSDLAKLASSVADNNFDTETISNVPEPKPVIFSVTEEQAAFRQTYDNLKTDLYGRSIESLGPINHVKTQANENISTISNALSYLLADGKSVGNIRAKSRRKN